MLLCFVFDCYVSNACSFVLCLIVTFVMHAPFFVFDCYVSNARVFVLCLIVTSVMRTSLFCV